MEALGGMRGEKGGGYIVSYEWVGGFDACMDFRTQLCVGLLRARWHCCWYWGLMDDGGRGMGRGGGVVEDVYVHAAVSEEGMEHWIMRA